MIREADQFAEEDWRRWGQFEPLRLLPPSPRSPEMQASDWEKR
jgi:hypothetical protein